MVETSLNPGVMLYENGVFRLGYSIRSSHASAKRELADRIRNMAEYVGGRAVRPAAHGLVFVLRADRKSTRLNSSHSGQSRMPSSA